MMLQPSLTNSLLHALDVIVTNRNLEVKLDKENKETSAKRLSRNNRNEDRGDTSTPGLWARGADCALDAGVSSVDAKSNRSKDPHKALAAHEREKKEKHLGAAWSNVDASPRVWCQPMVSQARKQVPC